MENILMLIAKGERAEAIEALKKEPIGFDTLIFALITNNMSREIENMYKMAIFKDYLKEES